MAIVHSHPTYAKLKKFLLSEGTCTRHCLSIDELAQRFNMSSIPIREALIRLAAEDLIDHEFGKGFYTKELSLKSVETNYRMLYQMIKLCISCCNTEIISCTKFLDWTASDPGYFDKIIRDNILFEGSINRSVMCVAGGSHFGFVSNVIQKTALFRKMVHADRTDIVETAGDIIRIAKSLTTGATHEAVQIMNDLEDRRLSSISKEYDQLMNQQADFSKLSDYLDG